jgi:hypothetical protein
MKVNAIIAGAPTKFPNPHSAVVARIPKDLEDLSDGGIDQAKLNLKAMEAALKM